VDKLLSVRDLSEWWSLSEDRIYTLSREGTIPHVRLGRTLRFSEARMLEFIASGGKGLSKNEKLTKSC